MDKFEFESFSQFRDVVEELQGCFIDGDAYSRTPAIEEWRRASRLVRRLSLMCFELLGYATACRQYQVISIRERLHVESCEGGESKQESEEEQGFVEFTKQEILQMPKKIQKLIIVNRKRCRLRLHKSGKETFSYEIRFRCDGYNVSASGKTLALAKAKMLQKLRTAKPKEEKQANAGAFPTVLKEFALYYCERFRKPKLSEGTYKNDLYRLQRYIFPTLGAKKIASISPADCEELLTQLKSEGKGKTADEIHSILSILFKGAIAHGIITLNPLSIVPHFQHVTKHGKALSREELDAFLEKIRGAEYEIPFAISTYTGLRPNELQTARVENGFIIAVNSKQHKKETVYKRIPICKRLARYLETVDFDLSKILIRRAQYYSFKFKELFPSHKLYDLRTTFYSKAKELGVSEHALKAYMGHSNGKIGNAYTDLSDEYLLKEGKKLDNW